MKFIVILATFICLSAFSRDMEMLRSNDFKNDCSLVQQNSLNKLQAFIDSHKINGLYTAVAVADIGNTGCTLYVTLQNSNYRLVLERKNVYSPSIWEKGNIENSLNETISKLESDPNYLLHTVSKSRTSTLNTYYEVFSLTIVQK